MSSPIKTQIILPAALKHGEDRVQINPSGISQNTDTHIIGITEDKLHRILKEHQQNIIRSRDWAVPLGLLLSLLTTLLTSSFNNAWLSAEQWKYIFICGAGTTAYLTFASAIRCYRTRPMTVKELVDTIAGRKQIND